MAFLISKRFDGESSVIENNYLMTDAEGATLGEGLVMGGTGRLTKAGATVTPEFVAMCARTAEATSITPMPVMRVNETMEFETTSTATVASTLIGSKVTLHTTGDQITATVTSGVFYVTATDGVATTSRVRGMFRR